MLKQAYESGQHAAFEKFAILWRPGADPKKFTELAGRLASNRAKSVGVELQEQWKPDLGTRLISKIPGPVGEASRTAGQIKPNAGIHFSPSALPWKKGKISNTESAIPAALKEQIPGDAEQVMPTFMHHELDELDAFNKHKYDYMVQGFKNIVAGKMSMGGYYGHMSPEIILRESNNVFHGITPEGKGMMQHIRNNISGEAQQTKKMGLRYGEEYLPEGGRRWNKLLAKMQPHFEKHMLPRYQEHFKGKVDLLKPAVKKGG